MIIHAASFYSHCKFLSLILLFGFFSFSSSSSTNTLSLNPYHQQDSTFNVSEQGNAGRVEQRLARARAAIREAVRTQRYLSNKNESFVPRSSIYRNVYAFHQSHIEMRKRFKVWVYREGDDPIFHNGPMKDIYSIEGQVIDELDTSGKSPYSAHSPDEASVFFLPFSVTKAVLYLYPIPRAHYQRYHLQNVVTDYISIISHKYPYWNRSRGADHFFIGCHDWGPDVSAASPLLYRNVIRVLCNANTSEGFNPTRDATLPEIKIQVESLEIPSLGQSPGNRSIFAFFAGGNHGDVRSLLFESWYNKKDTDIQVHSYLPENLNYYDLMGRAKFCLCPSGWEVASPRVIESIYAGCVPVIISDNYVLPFSDVLDWTRFSIHIPVADIPHIKTILKKVSYNDYLQKQKLLKDVQRHFTIHRPAQPFDLLDMVFHSIWLRRLNLKILGT
ncbi:hypothetical protein DCAR_0103271 [Daucus carota subsp. sativus]|uniref:Exostosin GT47 domain-containing protein n=2 Tax=Daucus carota subsp. sativus TaxID=79200 RepID=A0AAF1AL13_DAUCS|nr:hypothetical protein DCAR_0103271 [Daucus carota subsp. sativus]